jgi:SAM-dependent methyltransferase
VRVFEMTQPLGYRPRMTDKPPGFFDGTEMPTAGWWEALWPDPADVLTEVGIQPNMSVMDLCSGDGWFTLQIARIARYVVAIDIDPDLLAIARHRLAESGLTNCDFVAGDAYDLTRLCSDPVDFVFMANAFHGVPDPARLARSVERALSPGGRFAVVNWHPRPREETTVLGEPRGPRTDLRISPEVVKTAVEPSGLALVEVLEIAPYHYAAIFEKAYRLGRARAFLRVSVGGKEAL